MASFEFSVSNGAAVINGGSGLGWFGPAGFGSPVLADTYADKVYITDPDGSVQGAEAWNVKWTHPGSGLIGQTGSGLALNQIPNHQASIRARFDSGGSAVKTTNARFYAYDRTSLANSPSGVIVQACEVIHPDTAQTPTGSGSSTWTQIAGTGSYLSLISSPGLSGLRPHGANTSSRYHDHYICVSVQPSVLGTITQLGFSLSLEYL